MLKTFILVVNNKREVLKELISDNKAKYIAYPKSAFDNLPEKTVLNLIKKRGLYASGAPRHNQSLVGLHRVVLALYDNILGHPVHHIDKNIFSNNITNLVKLKQSTHIKIDGMVKEEGVIESLKEQKKLKDSLFKPVRNTLANNPNVIVEILKLSLRLNAKEIEKTIKGKVKKSKIYEILNLFYYSKEFLKWLFSKKINGFSPLDGKFKSRWRYILEFESED